MAKKSKAFALKTTVNYKGGIDKDHAMKYFDHVIEVTEMIEHIIVGRDDDVSSFVFSVVVPS